MHIRYRRSSSTARTAMVVVTLAASYGLGGCGGTEPEDLGSQPLGILNGMTANESEQDGPIVIVNFPTLTSSGRACSGTFVHPHYILTAAHCLPLCQGSQTGCLRAGHFMDVVYGDHWEGVDGPINARAASDVTPWAVQYTVEHVYFPRPDHFDPHEPAPDVALLRVRSPFPGKVIPVMPSQTLPHPRTHCDLHDDDLVYIAGYSGNAWTEPAVRRLGKAIVECDLERGDRAYMVDSRGRYSKMCHGDAGGPVMWADGYGRREVGGVLSYYDYDCPELSGESGVAFIPRPFLEERARNDPRCRGSWDACVGDPVSAAHLGCYRDSWRGRDLSGLRLTDVFVTPRWCMEKCRDRGFLFAGTQYGKECFCDNDYGRWGPATNCDMPCARAGSEVCGGTWANDVYRLATYQGCYADESSRDLTGYSQTQRKMTVDRCLRRCRERGYAFAATQNGRQCFCDNTFGKYGPSTNCNMRCSGNRSQTCGGAWANSVWRTH